MKKPWWRRFLGALRLVVLDEDKADIGLEIKLPIEKEPEERK